MFTLISFACHSPPPSPDDFNESIDLAELLSSDESSIESIMDWYNNPDRFEEEYIVELNELPLAGRLDTTPWSGDFWAKDKGGIAYRWQTQETFTYDKYSREELLQMNPEQISLLSPAEKYDLFVSNYNYPLTSRVIAEGNTNEPSWAGYCHGWAPASDRFNEPTPQTMTNADGISIPFGSSDIKALLTYFEAEVVRSSFVGHDWSTTTFILGAVCFSERILDPSCHDTNPASFHIVLANRIGLMNNGFNMDVDKGYEKWNQPVYGFQSQILETRPPSENALDETVVEYIMQTEVHWTVEIHPTWDTVLWTENQKNDSKKYTYSLEVDENGEIIGGQWLYKTNDDVLLTIEQVWNYFATLDEDMDGIPDLEDEEINAYTWMYFEIPDYLWYQTEVSTEYDFQQLTGPYDILATTATSREKLFRYFGALHDLIRE